MFSKMRHARKGPAPLELRKEKSFRAALAKEYGVEKVPESLRRAMDEAYKKLPEDMPLPHRPVRTFVRRTATAFAMLAVVTLGLLGVNASYPQLTEAIPGLGSVFQAMNGGEKPAPTPVVQPDAKPSFQPVRIESKDGQLKQLSVEDAWSDGNTLYLDLSLDLSEELCSFIEQAGQESDGYGDPVWEEPAAFVIAPTVWEEYIGGSFHVDGLDLTERVDIPTFEYSGDGKAKGQMAVDLTGVEVEDEIKVGLAMPEMSLEDLALFEYVQIFTPDFEASFSVPVDTSRNYTFQMPVQDNGVTLHQVEFSPSKVVLDVEVPNIGRIGDLLLPLEPGDECPLGLYPTLTNWDSSSVWEYDYLCETSGEEYPEEQASWNLRFTFRSTGNARNVRGPLRFTLFETPEWTLQGDEIDAIARRRVVAEFTINLATGRIMPSENYKEEGREKVDMDRDLAGMVESTFINGFQVQEASVYPTEHTDYTSDAAFSREAMRINLQARSDDPPRNLLFTAYRDGSAMESTVIQQFAAAMGSGSSSDENGQYSEVFYNSSTGVEYRMLFVYLYYPEWAYNQDGTLQVCSRIELSDADTGEVLIPDLEAALAETYQKIIGGAEASGTPPPASAPGERDDVSSSANSAVKEDAAESSQAHENLSVGEYLGE